MSNGEIARQVFPPCCPDLQPSENCDVLDFHYRQLYPVTVGDQRRPVTVEVILNVRLDTLFRSAHPRRPRLQHYPVSRRKSAALHFRPPQPVYF